MEKLEAAKFAKKQAPVNNLPKKKFIYRLHKKQITINQNLINQPYKLIWIITKTSILYKKY